MHETLIQEVNQVVEKASRKEVDAETYADRLRLFRAGLILLTGGVAGVGSIAAFAPLMMELPSPLGVGIPLVCGTVGLAFGSLVGEGLSIAAAKITSRNG